MLVGILQFELIIHGAMSLKDKRRVVKSLKDRLHREHMVSVAETAALDHPRLAVMGLAVVSNSAAHAGQVMDHVVHKLRSLHDAELGAMTREILHGVQPEPGDSAWDEDDETVGKSGARAVAPAREDAP